MQKGSKKAIFVSLAVAALVLALGTQGIFAAGGKEAPGSAGPDYPAKAVQVVVPVGAGGDTDMNARLFSKYLEKELKQTVVIVNVTGGGGTIGMKRVLDSAPDGYTVLFYHTEAMIPKIAGLVDYDISDFAIAGIGVLDNTTVLATFNGAPYKTMKEFVDYAKANPGKVEFGMQTGGYPHLIGIALQEMAGIKLNIVDVGGNAAKTVALKGKKTDVINTQYGLTKDFFVSGDFVCLGLTSDARNPLMSDIPTTKEQGFPMVFNKFFFYGMPKSTPKAIVDIFSAAMKRVVDNPEYQAEAAKIFVNPMYMDPAASEKHAMETYKYLAQFQDLFRAAGKK